MSTWLGGGFGVSLAVSLALAVLLGLRHATDPDHLTAVATLMISERDGAAARAGRLGLAWGLGHATTLFLFGLPVVLFGRVLPTRAHELAELAVGVMISLLALRLLRRWRKGYFHTHPHEHDGRVHAHPHFHDEVSDHAAEPHEHLHASSHAQRAPIAAFGVGLLHGIGGSAGAGVLLIAAITQRVEAMTALVSFAGATAISMALVSAGAGHLLARGRSVSGFMERAVPIFGLVSLGVGVWYSLAALGIVGL